MDINLPLLKLRDYQMPSWNYMLQDKVGLRAAKVWPRRNGKDLTDINILAAKAIQRPGLYHYIAPFANQVRSIIWDGADGTGKKFLDYIPRELVTRKLDQQMKLWLANGSMIQLVGSDNPDAVVGTNPLGQVYTEYSLHKPAIWEYMRPVLAENGGWAIFNGTPRGLNHFYKMCMAAQTSPDWFYQHLSCLDTGFPSLEAIEKERKDGMPESLIQQEFYTSWTAVSEDTLIPLEAVQRCMRLVLQQQEYDFAPRIIGVDPAYAATGDRAVIARRQGRYVHPFEVYRGKDPMALAERVAYLAKTWRADWIMVDAGRGEAIWSRLRQMGYTEKVIIVDFAGSVYEDLYARKKDQIWGRMRDAICDQVRPVKLPEDLAMAADLSAPMFTLDDRHRMVLESKKSLKTRGINSTDIGDALAITYAEDLDETQPLETEAMLRLGITTSMLASLETQQDYDPLSYMSQYAN